MPSTHLSLHYHVVFSTKDRQPSIAAEWRPRLHEYLGGLVRSAEGVPEAIGGTADHIHLLTGLRATHTLSAFVQDIKQSSSRWVHETIGVRDFLWQQGYGAFTVSVANVDAVKRYIAGHLVLRFQPLCGWLISMVALRLRLEGARAFHYPLLRLGSLAPWR